MKNESLIPDIPGLQASPQVASTGFYVLIVLLTGFALASTGAYSPVISVLFPENDPATANPLNNQVCAHASHGNQTAIWTKHFGQPIADRLNSLAPGAGLNAIDAVNLMGLCPFDSLSGQIVSPWCELFTKKEWAQWEYLGDLGKYYGAGWVLQSFNACHF
jgi:hypothetical protein